MTKTILIRNAIMALLLTAAASCEKNVAGDGNIPFILNADTVCEGYSVPVRLTMKDGSQGPFSVRAEVKALNTLTGEDMPAGAAVMHGINDISTLGQISFPDDGHADFRVDGLPKGTYAVTMTLSTPSGCGSATATAVVLSKDDKGGLPVVPPDPDGRTFVQTFSLPVDEHDAPLDDDGRLMIDNRVWSKNTPYRYVSTINPDDASNARLIAMTDSPTTLKATIEDGNVLVLVPGVMTGEVKVTVCTSDWTVVRTMHARVFNNTEDGVRVKDFIIPDIINPLDGKFTMNAGEVYSFAPRFEPANVTDRSFLVTSTDPSVVSGSWSSDGGISITALSPGYADIRIYSEGGNGPSKVIPVKVCGTMTVKVFFEEYEATDAQMRTKTFPCNLMFTTDCGFVSKVPVRFSVAMTCEVYKDYVDTKRVVSRKDVLFYGKDALYDVCENILIPAYRFYLSTDHKLRISAAVTWDTELDPSVWTIVVDEAWKSQTGLEISKYIVK